MLDQNESCSAFQRMNTKPLDRELLVTVHGARNLYLWEPPGADLFLRKQVPLSEAPYLVKACNITNKLYVGVGNEIAVYSYDGSHYNMASDSEMEA